LSLQWGRRQTSTERHYIRKIGELVHMLQWGRRQTSTERIAIVETSGHSMRLQWGRRQTSTERTRCALVSTRPTRRFNGAADKRRRRVGKAAVGLGTSILASMGPPTNVDGEEALGDGAEDRSVASMGPPTNVDGELCADVVGVAGLPASMGPPTNVDGE